MPDSEHEIEVAPTVTDPAPGDPPVSPVDQAALLNSVKQQLEAARQSSQAAFDRVSSDLQRLQPPQPVSAQPTTYGTQTIAGALESIASRQKSIETLIRESLQDSLPAGNASPPDVAKDLQAPDWAVQWQSAFSDQLAKLEIRFQSLFDELKDRVPPSGPEPASAIIATTETLDLRTRSADGAQAQTWLRMLLGDDLSSKPQLKQSIQWIEQQVLCDNGDAMLLLGQLLVFRFSNADRKPMLLKDVGEVFYRCFPKNRDERDLFEESLAAWLTAECNSLGLPNSIELVQPGERFDASKHAPIERGGVEIARVLGWVVMRDGGRVFAKASVQTR